MRILITGASGLLGLNLALEASNQHQVYGLVNRHSLHTTAFRVLKGDLQIPSTVERVLDQSQPDWVIHCAALANVDACETDPLQARQLNTEIPGKLASIVARGGARLIHISTDAVFDGQRGDYTELDEPNPLSSYGRTKLEGERLVAAVNPDAIIARVNFYGWSPSGQRSLSEFFFNNLSAGKQVNGFTDVYFCPLLVNALAHILLQMLSNELRGLYHVVSSECISKYSFGIALAKKFGFDVALITPTLVSESGLKAVRSPRLTLKVDKLTAALGTAPPNIAPGLERYYQLYLQGYPKKVQEMRWKSKSASTS